MDTQRKENDRNQQPQDRLLVAVIFLALGIHREPLLIERFAQTRCGNQCKQHER